MNKVYRTVFNETTNTWVAVAEISPAKGNLLQRVRGRAAKNRPAGLVCT